MKSLNGKLILLVSMILALSLLCVSAISYFKSSSMMEESLGKEHFLKAREASLELDVFLQQQKAIFDAATATSNKHFGNHTYFMNQMKELMERFPEYLLMSYSFDKLGKEVHIHSGVVIDASDLLYVQRVMKEKKGIVSDPIISKSTGKPCVVAVSPLFVNGETNGFLGGCIEFEKALDKVINTTYGKTGFSVLVDTQGRFLHHPNKELIMEKTIFDVKDKNLEKMFKEIKNGKSGKMEFEENDVKKFATYAPTESGWGIFTITPLNEIYQPVLSLTKILLLASVLTLTLGIFATYLVARGIVKPIKRLDKVMGLVAKGELHHSVTLSGKDEIASLSQSFNITVDNLRKLVEEVSTSSHKVNGTANSLNESVAGTKEISTSITSEANKISRKTESDLEKIYYMVESIDKLTKEIQSVSDSNEKVVASSNQSATMAKEGKKAADEAVEKIDYLKGVINNVASVIGSLDNRIHEINEVLKLITDISHQTNLLSLNAAIEAARAGESGKGFSVVADEVRKLSEQTNQAVGKISNTISEIERETKIAVTEVTDGVNRVNEGLYVVKNPGETFEQINEMVEKVASQISDVTQVIENMSLTSDELTSFISPLMDAAETTNMYATNVSTGVYNTDEEIRKVADVTNELIETSKKLEDMIGKFKTK